MSQTELNYSVSTVNNKNGTPFILVKQSAGDINSIIDPYGLKLYRDNGNDPYVPQELIVKEHDTHTIDLELNTSSPKSYQEGKQLAIAKNITLNDQEQRNPYKRVGCTYYKTLFKKDRYGILRVEYKLWRKDEIRQDYGKEYLKAIPHYDEFTILPNNINYKSVVNNCINIYFEFAHKPKVGDWVWTERLLKQVFGEQYELGLRYMQILYLHPDRLTIILVLVSKERGTGKTTFINWLNMIFGANMVVLSNTDFSSSFNSFCTKNIIAVEETFLEKKAAVEKLKALATAKQVQINEKFVSPYMLPFFGKIILTSNNEDKFVQVDEEEIRYFVRKLGKPEFINHHIEDELLKEIPAFLSHLQSLPSVDWSVSRSGFTPEELYNECLQAVVDESKSGLAKDLKMEIIDYFENNDAKVFLADSKDIKNKFFSSNSQYNLNYIRNVLKNEFRMRPKKNSIRYTPFEEMLSTKTGRPYEFRRCDFVTESDVTNNET